jgi:hypothetical protein
MNKIIGSVIIAILAAIVVEMLFDLNMFSILIGIAAGGIAAIILSAFARGEKPEVVAREVAKAARDVMTEPPSVTQERTAQEQLFRACTSFVTSGAGDVETKNKLQLLTDVLRGVLPRALEFAPESETTFNIMKLAREDLPNLLQSFVNLPLNQQKAKASELIVQFDGVTQKLKRLVAIIDQGSTSKFDAESAFINFKFS